MCPPPRLGFGALAWGAGADETNGFVSGTTEPFAHLPDATLIAFLGARPLVRMAIEWRGAIAFMCEARRPDRRHSVWTLASVDPLRDVLLGHLPPRCA